MTIDFELKLNDALAKIGVSSVKVLYVEDLLEKDDLTQIVNATTHNFAANKENFFNRTDIIMRIAEYYEIDLKREDFDDVAFPVPPSSKHPELYELESILWEALRNCYEHCPTDKKNNGHTIIGPNGYTIALAQALSFNARKSYKNKKNRGGFVIYDDSQYHTIFFDDPTETRGVFILGSVPK